MKNFYVFVILVLLFSCKDKEVETPIENNVIEKEETPVVKELELIFTVQIAALKNKNSKLSNLENIKIYKENGFTKYRIGEFETYEEARNYSIQLRKNHSDAFVQALKNGYPIRITEALNN